MPDLLLGAAAALGMASLGAGVGLAVHGARLVARALRRPLPRGGYVVRSPRTAGVTEREWRAYVAGCYRRLPADRVPGRVMVSTRSADVWPDIPAAR